MSSKCCVDNNKCIIIFQFKRINKLRSIDLIKPKKRKKKSTAHLGN